MSLPQFKETYWSNRWEAHHSFRVTSRDHRAKFFNFDSGPFPNGYLHLGHARTYTLGDVVARFQRLQGRAVLYATEWDSFGIPNELGARAHGVSPDEFTRVNIDCMKADLRRLGISYDWGRVYSTSDPNYYRWTQWLFLQLFNAGLLYRKISQVPWCETCRTSMSLMELEVDKCWRCHNVVDQKEVSRWYVKLSSYWKALDDSANDLTHWTETSRKRLSEASGKFRPSDDPETQGDWQVSRDRSWGTPIPIIYCARCGIVPDNELPIVLPEDLDWSLGSGALKDHALFTKAKCPQCSQLAQRETQTLDCFFDDSWSLYSCIENLSECKSFPGSSLRDWLPVDEFHSGYDTVFYLHLYRFVSRFLKERGAFDTYEPVTKFAGNDVLLNMNRKMSKSTGNLISVRTIIDGYGADVLRLAVLSGAASNRVLHWNEQLLAKSSLLIARIHGVFEEPRNLLPKEPCSTLADFGALSDAMKRLRQFVIISFKEIGNAIEASRPHMGIVKIEHIVARIRSYFQHRINARRITDADARALKAILQGLAIVVSPFAPYTGESINEMIGGSALVAMADWPNWC